jgi:hypothetical protein
VDRCAWELIRRYLVYPPRRRGNNVVAFDFFERINYGRDLGVSILETDRFLEDVLARAYVITTGGFSLCRLDI